MKFTTPDSDEFEVNLIPLIDVILVLLIFFMATATFDHQSRIKLRLPTAAGEPVADVAPPLVVQIDAEGRYFVNNSEVLNTRIETLMAALQQVAVTDRSQQVLLKADGRASHQAVVTAMDALAQLGFGNLSIATVGGEGNGG